MTIEELYEIIKEQQTEINDLKCHLSRLKEWSDLNDYYLREMIDALTDTTDGIVEYIYHKEHKISKEVIS